MSGQAVTLEGADIDPDLRRFMAINAAAYTNHPPLDGLTLNEKRAVFEAVREQWRVGGPVMAWTKEVFFEGRHGPVRVRIHHPGGEGALPALIYLHGGGWMIFSLDTHDRLMREYAARAGVVVFGIDYPLSPEVRFPVALEQIVDVVPKLVEHAAEFGVDGSRLAIGGDSAGGNLSVATCLSLRDQGKGALISGMVLNYAVLARDPCPADIVRYGGPAYVLEMHEMEDFWANYLARPEDAQNPLADLSRADLTGLPPVVLIVPECDLLTGESHAFAERLKAAGGDATLMVYPGATHSFLEAVEIAPIADKGLADASAWLRERLGR